MAIPELDTEAVQAARTQRELADWLDARIDDFRSTREGREAWRLYKGGFVKQVVEELLPIRWYADACHLDDEEKTFALVLGNQSYDAVVHDKHRRVVKYLQVTLAFDGYQSRLRAEHLETYGHAPVTGVILGRDENGKVREAEAQCEERNERLAAEFGQVHDAFQRKANYRYEENTTLVIHFRSDGVIDDEYIGLLDSYVKDKVLQIEHGFQELVLVSGNLGLHLCYDVSEY